MRFPLYHRPNAFVFLDDDASYLEMLALVIPKNWNARFYTHIDDCIKHLKQEQAQWEADVGLHHTLVNNWRSGMPLLLQILRYWQTHTQRYDLTKVFVVDFSMPAMNGLDVLKTLHIWPSNRVLLTGKADEQIAVSAFNEGLINKFVPKQQPDVGEYLTAILTELYAKPMDFYDGIWRSTLKNEQIIALQESSVLSALNALVIQRGWIEYVVVAEPFGVLGLDAAAQPHWLQLEPASDLADAAELAHSAGQDQDAVQKIRQGTQLTNCELLAALRSDQTASLAPAFQIGQSGALLGAFFDVPGGAGQGISYDDFMSSLPPRSVT